MIRAALSGWMFALVLLAAWLGLLQPGSATTESDKVVSLGKIEVAVTEVLSAIERWNPSEPQRDTPEGCGFFPSPNIPFGPDSAEVSTQVEQILFASLVAINSQACLLDATGTPCAGAGVAITVFGHTDARPTARHGGNQQLSTDRAEAVAAWLTAAGATIGSTFGLADARPLPAPVPDYRSAAERLADNRRASIELWCT